MPTSEPRTASVLLKWRVSDFAKHAELSLASIQRMEQNQGKDRSSAKNVEAVRKTLDDAGVKFIPENGAGVSVKCTNVSSLSFIAIWPSI